MKRIEKEKCCGACCWFGYEDIDGWGQVPTSRHRIMFDALFRPLHDRQVYKQGNDASSCGGADTNKPIPQRPARAEYL